MKYWLLKSEPGDYSIDDLQSDKVTPWDGVRNYQARNMMRDDMKIGDKVLFYHSNAGDETGVVGEAKVASDALVDVTQFDKKDSHYDPKATRENPRWWCPEVEFVSKFKTTVTLEELKCSPAFTDSRLTKKGNRLSVVPVTKKQYEAVVKASNN